MASGSQGWQVRLIGVLCGWSFRESFAGSGLSWLILRTQGLKAFGKCSQSGLSQDGPWSAADDGREFDGPSTRICGSRSWEHLGSGTFFLSLRPSYAFPVRAVFENGTWPRSEISNASYVIG